MKQSYLVIDFDSTFTKVEALDALCEIVLAGNRKKQQVLSEIQDITDQAMDGKLDFRTSLSKRLSLIKAHREHIQLLIERLKNEISDSFRRNQSFIAANKEHVYIVSNGFKDFIVPVVEDYGLKAENVFANDFEYDESGFINGFNRNNPLSESGGKPRVISQLKLEGKVYVIGDGYNDFEIRKEGFANKFFLFTENIEREKVKPSADLVVTNVDEILFELKMSRALSYPKNRIKVLLLEGVHSNAVKLFEKEGYQVEYMHTALSEEELCKKIPDVNILGIRSKTQVTRKVISKASRLINIGAFCIGTNQIDLEACSDYGVAVFNAPYENTRSVVELAIAEMILLVRNLPDKMRAMHEGRWEKSAQSAREIRGKKLGIIGYGNIGKQLSIVGEALGLDVYFYDIEDRLALGNATKCTTIDELLGQVDIVSLHIDGRTSNNNLFGEKEFAKMKSGAIFMNLARGKVVDVKALKEAIENGKIKGCAVDVFPKEPKSNNEPFESELMGMRNTLLSPHIGGSTIEAQENIGIFVPNKIISYVNSGSTNGSVNLPNVQLPPLKGAHRLLHIHRNIPNVLAQITNILSKNNTNIVGQYLKTNESVGYVISDIDKAYGEQVINELKAIEGTIWLRVLY